MTKKKEKSFEDKLKRLEEITAQLESEEIGLQEAIRLYEEGINLSKMCYLTLRKAELKVNELHEQLEENFNDELDFDE